MAFNVFELYAKLGLDKSSFDKDLEKAKKEAENAGNSTESKLKGFGNTVSKIGSAIGSVGSMAMSAIGTATKVTGAALAGAATGVIALAKQSYGAYAEYQQMVGGVQKLYGNMGMSLEDYAASMGTTTDAVEADWKRNEEAQSIVMENAKNAFKTVGMSANQYMETATQFSASLISSLGGDTAAAAEQTQVAMQAISDNWNTFGGDLESIKHAFTGFAKQNFTMLDNLKLGYGGTKTEMERLIADANEYAAAMGMASDLSIDSFSDIVTAIDLIQQKQHIAGTTSREAATTISGSFGALKAAWENLVTGFADPNADLGQLISDVVNSASGALQNAIPTIVQALGGIGQAVEQIAPIIGEKLPELIEQVLPSLLSAATTLVQSLADSLPTILSVISAQLPTIIETLLPVALQGLVTIFQAIAEALPMALQIISDNIGIVTDGLVVILSALGNILIDSLPVLIPAVISVISGLANALVSNIQPIIEGGITIIMTLADALTKPENIKAMVNGAKTVLLGLMKGFTKIMPTLIPQLVDAFCVLAEALTDPEVLEDLIMGALECTLAIVEGLAKAAPRLGEAVITIIGNLIQTIIDKGPEILADLWTLLEGILTTLFGFVMGLLGSSWEDIQENFTAVFEFIGQWFSDVWESIGKFFVDIGTSIGGFFSDAWESITGFFGDVFSGTWLSDIWDSITGFFSDVWDKLTGWVGDIWDKVTGLGTDLLTKVGEIVAEISLKFTGLIDDALTWGKDLIWNIIDGITGVAGDLWDACTDIASGIADFLGFSVPRRGPLHEWATANPGADMIKLFAEGVDDEEPTLDKTISNVAGMIDDTMNNIDVAPIEVDAFGKYDVKSSMGGSLGAQGMNIETVINMLGALLKRKEIIDVYIGNRRIEEIVVDAYNNVTLLSGGQVNV